MIFFHKRLDHAIIKKTALFEKAEIKWVCVDDVPKMRPQFRHYFRKIADRLFNERDDIMRFIKNGKKSKTHKNRVF